MRNKLLRWIWTVLLVSALLCGAFLSHAEEEIPISLEITVTSDTKLETAGTVDSLTFTISNNTDEPYTLYHAKLSGGFDEEIRALNDVITVEAKSTREFSLSDIAVSDEQLDTDIVYILSWDEMIVTELQDDAEDSEVTDGEDHASETEPGDAAEPGDGQDSESGSTKTVTEYIPRSIEASIRIERFVPPELGVSVQTSSASAAEGDTFSITYTISNHTKYDMSGIMLTDSGVYDGAIPIPATELMAGDSITITIDYVMGDQDMVFHPIVSYVASQRQFESRPEEPVIVGSVVTAIKIEVEQYPSNVEGSTFAITITNIGNRMLTGLQLYDEINTEIDDPFDLAAQQQKVITFNVPSAYSAGLIRTVRFRVTGYDFFGDPFSYTDVNSYDCIPYITSDEVRLSVLATVRNAYYDEDGKLCGEILLEIRNYSDVRLTNAFLSELTLFGTLETYRELLRGETYASPIFQLDGVSQLQFCVTANDPTGQTYTSEITVLSLDQLASLATKPQGQKIVYQSNSFLKELTNKVTASFKNALLAAFILVMASTTICLVLWFLEERLKSKLPSESQIRIVVPESKTPKTSMDQVLNSSPAEQLGYTVPTKIRYGTTTIKTSTNAPGKAKRFIPNQPLSKRDSQQRQENRRKQTGKERDDIWSSRSDSSTQVFLAESNGKSSRKPAPLLEENTPALEDPTLLAESLIGLKTTEAESLEESGSNTALDSVLSADESVYGMEDTESAKEDVREVWAEEEPSKESSIPQEEESDELADCRSSDEELTETPEMHTEDPALDDTETEDAFWHNNPVTDISEQDVPNTAVTETEADDSSWSMEISETEDGSVGKETGSVEWDLSEPEAHDETAAGELSEPCADDEKGQETELPQDEEIRNDFPGPILEEETEMTEPELERFGEEDSATNTSAGHSVRILDIGPKTRKKKVDADSIIRVKNRRNE